MRAIHLVISVPAGTVLPRCTPASEEGGANAAALLPSGDRLAFQVRQGSDYEWPLSTASEDRDDYGVRAVRVEDGAVVTLVDTPDDEREGRWM